MGLEWECLTSIKSFLSRKPAKQCAHNFICEAHGEDVMQPIQSIYLPANRNRFRDWPRMMYVAFGNFAISNPYQLPTTLLCHALIRRCLSTWIGWQRTHKTPIILIKMGNRSVLAQENIVVSPFRRCARLLSAISPLAVCRHLLQPRPLKHSPINH